MPRVSHTRDEVGRERAKHLSVRQLNFFEAFGSGVLIFSRYFEPSEMHLSRILISHQQQSNSLRLVSSISRICLNLLTDKGEAEKMVLLVSSLVYFSDTPHRRSHF